MHYLVVNDDGINASGIKILTDLLKKYGTITVIAPKYEQSAKSHSICIHGGIEITKLPSIENVDYYCVDSTPADCVRFAHYGLFLDYDIVFSGINNGFNLGEDIIYSGTVAGASEAYVEHKKGIAISAPYHHPEAVIDCFDMIMEYISVNKLLDDADILNINVPINPKGIKITHQGHTHFDTVFFKESDGLYYQKGKPHYEEDAILENSDVTAINNNYISITPLVFDRTDYLRLKK